MNKQTRRKFSSKQKGIAVKRHVMEKEAISSICEDLGIAPNQFYRWQHELFEHAEAAFEVKKPGRRSKTLESKLSGQITELQDKLTQKDNVIAEVAAECVKLKKNLGLS